MTSGRIYELTVRTPEAQKCARRRVRIKRAAIAVGMVAALLTPGTVEAVSPAFCAGQWEC